MNDEELLRILRFTVCSDIAPELTDQAVDEFISASPESSPEHLRRLTAKFVEKVFASIHGEPVKDLQQKWTFGRWFEAMRESVRLTRKEIATALNQDPSFVERLEAGDVVPWAFSARDIGDLVCLFRVHMNAVSDLISNSIAVSQLPGLGPVAARSQGGRISEARGHSAKRALDLYLARKAGPAKPDQTVTDWMSALRSDLKRRGAKHLL